ncbi:solute carrier family 17 member 9 isoform X7 [Ursus arctos]|uniref:solute carrier family 17 member 9 isoform X7 n=1 Tax=Ursus arctos TaxID=9644 RepID=UPI0025478C9D|nr:solute carrier family 17 member 9 isoform X7 [Ursus arctos]
MQPLPPEEARRDGAEDAQWSRPECQAWTGTLLLGTCLLYCARVSMPVCTVSMSQDFGWNKKEAGIVLSSFFWGYCLTQVVGGHLGDRRVLPGADQPAVPEGTRERASLHLQCCGGWLPVRDTGDRGHGLPAPGLVRLAERLLLLRRAHPAVGVLRVQISSWPWASWRKACRCPGTPKFPGDSFSESPPSGRPSPPSCRPRAPSSSSSPGCPPSLRRHSPAPRLQDHRCAEVHAGDGPRAVQRFCPVFGPHLELLQVCGLCISVHWPADLQPQRHFSQHPGPGPILCRLSVWCGQHSWGLGRCRGRVPGRLPHRDHRLLDIHVQPGGCRQQPGAVHLPAVWRGPASGPEPHPRGPLAAPADRSFSAVCLGVMGSVGEPPTPDSRCVNRGRASPSRAGQPWVGLSFSSEVIVPSPQGSWTVRGEWS